MQAKTTRLIVIGLAITGLVITATRAVADPNSDLLGAAKSGDVNRAVVALSAGANVNTRNDEHLSPLDLAAINGREGVAKLLLKRGADTAAPITRGATGKAALVDPPLIEAAAHGNGGVVAALLDGGVNVNQSNVIGDTPLHVAARNGQLNVVDLLLSRGADVNSQDAAGATPLLFASGFGHRPIVIVLLAHGANPAIRSVLGQTALSVASSPEIVDALQPAFLATNQPPLTIQSGANYPSCTDVPGIARWLKKNNPNIDGATGYEAILQYQILLGCRTPEAPAGNSDLALGSRSEGCGLRPLPPLPPLGCREMRPICVGDAGGKNYRWQFECVAN